MSTIKIEQIKIGSQRRALKPEKVTELKESIKINGLLNAITVDRELNLVAGLHRLTACKLLGFTTINCNVVDYEDASQLRLAEIDENLIRSELEALERAELWLEREKILDKMGLRAKSGDNQHARHKPELLGKPLKTTEELAKETGYTKRTYQYGKQIASKILPEVKQVIKGTQVAKKTTALLEIARAGSAAHKQADAAEKAARQAKIAGDREEANRQAIIVAKARAKQKELQLSTLAKIQESKATPNATEEINNECRSPNKPVVRVGDEWLLGRHLVYCGDTYEGNFINLLPTEAALAIATSTSDWNHDYLVERARVVAVVLEEDRIFDFCTRQRMPFQFEMLFGKLYVAFFSRQSLAKPRKPQEIDGIEGVISYLINQYTDRKLGLFAIAPSLGNGEILIACERMGRICFAGDCNPEIATRTISRWQNLTNKSAVRENYSKSKSSNSILDVDRNLKFKASELAGS
jgi:ParB family chromosome partitioning protein